MNEILASIPRIRSYVRREGRITEAQRDALEIHWEAFGLFSEAPLDLNAAFGRKAPRILEIGFGNGDGLFELALQMPDHDFVGIEVYRSGVGGLLSKVHKQGLKNVRVFCADAVEVLEKVIVDESFDQALIFFPDPWQKRRHHKRRLIQPSFVKLIRQKIKKGGELYLATDWEDYAHHMMTVMEGSSGWINAVGKGKFSPRASLRPFSKFELRGLRHGHSVWDLIFIKQENVDD